MYRQFSLAVPFLALFYSWCSVMIIRDINCTSWGLGLSGALSPHLYLSLSLSLCGSLKREVLGTGLRSRFALDWSSSLSLPLPIRAILLLLYSCCCSWLCLCFFGFSLVRQFGMHASHTYTQIQSTVSG